LFEYEILDIDNIARIGLMYIDGDLFEDVLLDKAGHTDYDFDKFNQLKISLLKLEKISPTLDIAAILWRSYPTNKDAVTPLIVGSALPFEGTKRTAPNRELALAFKTGERQVRRWNENCRSYYYPFYNSDEEIVGVLELLCGRGYKQDVDFKEMFNPPREKKARG
jgi:hypothetical protein